MIYAVVSFRGRERVKSAIQKAGLDFYEYDGEGSHIFFVYSSSTTNTTKDIAEQLGMREAGGSSGIVLPVNNYSGFANPNLWEWLRNHDNGF